MSSSCVAQRGQPPPRGGQALSGRHCDAGRAWATLRFALLFTVLAPSLCAWAQPARAAALPPAGAGNYCVACHTATDALLARTDRWQGGIEREAINPCPASVAIREERYYTERLLLALERGQANAPKTAEAQKIAARVTALRESYHRLLDTPLTSVEAYAAEAGALRYQLGKSYSALNRLEDAGRQTRILIVAALLTAGLLISLAWGLRTASRFAGGSVFAFRPGWRAVLLVGLVLALFALPIFRVFPREVASFSAEETERQAVLDQAKRVADAAERGQARAWMLARVAAVQAGADRPAAEQTLTAALAAAGEAQIAAPALWGEAQRVQEIAIGSAAATEKALLAADRLESGRGRAWGLRLIASEWATVDKPRSERILAQAAAVAEENTGIYRDLDLRGIAAEWARLNAATAVETAGRIHDPALRSWAFREAAAVAGDKALYEQAASAARLIADPVQRSRSLREAAAAARNATWFAEAAAALNDVQGVEADYALAEIAAASGNAALVERISPQRPEARTAALLGMAAFEDAWAASLSIADPFDRSHAQAAIAAAWRNPEAARRIADRTLADRALAAIAIGRKDATLASGISSPYARVQALAGLGQTQAALAATVELHDPLPLRDLAVALAGRDPQASLALVERLDREVDKARVLRAVAAGGDRAAFDRALNMALAARVRGDPLAPAEASLALARQVQDKAASQKALAQALDAAQKIAVKYR